MERLETDQAHIAPPSLKAQNLSTGFKLGEWLIQPRLNRVARGKIVVQVEPKIMRVLLYLAEHSGDVVTRDELVTAVWPDTFVVEETLTRAISELRKIFGDDPKSAYFIETIRKVGYRLVAQVVVESEDTSTSGVSAQMPGTSRNSIGQRQYVLLGSMIFMLALVALYSFYLGGLGRTETVSGVSLPRISPVSSFPGMELDPSLSPDGSKVAFARDEDRRGNFDIYVKSLTDGSFLRLTSDAAPERKPVWAPDGRSIAFIRRSEKGSEILTLEIGVAERKLTDCASISSPSLDWSPDAKWLAFVDRASSKGPYSIYLISSDGRERRKLTTPPANYSGDNEPVFSPDGQTVAFKRTVIMGIQDVYLAPAASGEAKRITFDNLKVLGLDWWPDGGSIVFSSNREGDFSLWRMSIKGGSPVWIPLPGNNIFHPSISLHGGRLVYEQWEVDTNIWQFQAVGGSVPTQLIASTRWDSDPQFSPDGASVAFASMQSGNPEIWKCNADGTNPKQLTFFSGPFTVSPRWSPDGKQIVFESRAGGSEDIYIIPVAGGTPRPLTDESSSETAPSWSRDGRSVYFASNRTGDWQVWRLAIDAGELTQITSRGGFAAIEGPAGKSIYYTRPEVHGIWVRTDAGEEKLFCPYLKAGQWRNWAMVDEGAYYVNSNSKSSAVEFMKFDTNQVLRIVELDDPNPVSLAVSPDRKTILISRVDSSESDVMLVSTLQ